MQAQAPPSKRPHRVAYVVYFPSSRLAWLHEFVAEQLKVFGYVEGENLTLDMRGVLGVSPEDQEPIYEEVVRSNPDVIVVDGTGQALRARKATRSIPIVMWASVDPVGAGLAQSLARPGGNVTGLAIDVDTGAEAKRMDLFLQMVPNARRVAFVGLRADWENPWGLAVRDVAARHDVTLVFAEGKPAGYADALNMVKQSRVDAFFVALTPTTGIIGRTLGDFSVANRLPSSCGLTEMADSGCTMAYGQSVKDFIVAAISYVARILNGAKPSELPIEQPTQFHLVLNLKSAKSIGLPVPPALSVFADRVIE